MFAFFDGVGKLVSYALAATSFTRPKLVPTEPDFATDARLQFGIAALVALVCVGVTLVTVTEPAAPADESPKRSFREATVHAWTVAFKVLTLATPKQQAYELVPSRVPNDKREALERRTQEVFDSWTRRRSRDDRDALLEEELGGATAPTPDDDDVPDESTVSLSMLRRMCFVELGLWYGLSAWQVWGAILVGKSILGGSPSGRGNDVAKFEAGVLLFSLGLAGANLVSLLAAPLFPALLRLCGARSVMLAGSVVMTLAMTLLALLATTHSRVYLNDADTDSSFDLVTRDPTFLAAVLLLAALGLPWACHMNVPFSVVGRAYQDAPDIGLLTATLNTSLCVAQLLMSFSTSILIRLARGDAAVCFLAAALSGLFAAYHAAKLVIPYDERHPGDPPAALAACAH
mmetsp:Transcript_3414/g.10557  ORF Transcript_3414/g.10557 Transcript_3414/m.10557 type:complete len:403 (+) Transcript_3414:677-1885(+)